jgi:phage regulatory protein, rha family|nr:MAG TPA: regulatory protein [Caudoviricetes sp.]
MNEIFDFNGTLVISSRIIAKELSKRHDHVIRDLENILKNSETPNLGSLIIPSIYKVSGQKREYKEYLLTKDGFVLYMFNIQGYNDFKIKYINKFNEMENAIKNGNLITEDERLILNIVKSKTEAERTYYMSEYEKKVEKVKEENEDLKHEVNVYNSYLLSRIKMDIKYTTGELAKTYGIKANPMHKILKDLGMIESKVHEETQRKYWVLTKKYEDKYNKYAKLETMRLHNIPYLVWLEEGINYIFTFFFKKSYVR